MKSSTSRPAAFSVDRVSVILVAVAATLWATDAYFRNQLVSHLTPTEIVVAEDALITLFLVPVLIRSWPELRKLGTRGWIAVATIAVGAQSLATILFTASFQAAAAHGLFAETYVLQQTQPLIAMLLAWAVLGERRKPWFWAAVVIAIAAVYMVFNGPDLKAPLTALRSGRFEVGAYALGAAALWASGTVLGRYALGSISFWSMTSLRFALALPVLIVIAVAVNGVSAFSHYRYSDFVPNLLAIAILPGLLALLLYYLALAKTPASLATIAEMAYPVAATLIASAPPPWGFSQPLSPVQLAGTVLLIAVILILNWGKETSDPVVQSPSLKLAEG